jgi:hypothetical protein
VDGLATPEERRLIMSRKKTRAVEAEAEVTAQETVVESLADTGTSETDGESQADDAVSSCAPVPTFEDFLAGHKLGLSFEVVAVPPYRGHYVGNGISVGVQPVVFPLSQLVGALDASHVDSLLKDSRVSVRILG